MKWLMVLSLLLVLATPALGHKVIRDANGDIIETRENIGSSTIVRDQYGNIIRIRYYDDTRHEPAKDEPDNHLGHEDHDNE